MVLFAYNAIFFFGKYIYFQGTLVRLYEFIDRYIVFFTILEFMDLASRYYVDSGGSTRDCIYLQAVCKLDAFIAFTTHIES